MQGVERAGGEWNEAGVGGTGRIWECEDWPRGGWVLQQLCLPDTHTLLRPDLLPSVNLLALPLGQRNKCPPTPRRPPEAKTPLWDAAEGRYPWGQGGAEWGGEQNGRMVDPRNQQRLQ